ncbi:MAG: hydrolase 1, exosortase A system-associated [Sulfuritalea sp.]|nr:hydrolase 1, exosortase A system-associated [Sulfuritalea sp.]
MNCAEEAIRFACEGETLFGILARPEQPAELGIVIVVGGPQTRVGSHRQFVLLSRTLAAAGFPVLRFDVRGMGDSTGAQRSFEALTPDIGAAIDALQSASPAVKRVVLWGLCDAASAALLYCDETRDSRIAGLCLLNPWVRSEATLARTQVKHYYGQRLLQKEFWGKLLSGRLNIVRSVAELLRKLGQASSRPEPSLGFQERMARGWKTFTGPILLILSGNDYTAKEFREYAAGAPSWRGLPEQAGVTRVDVKDADHTFSSAQWRDIVAATCLKWLATTSERRPRA